MDKMEENKSHKARPENLKLHNRLDKPSEDGSPTKNVDLTDDMDSLGSDDDVDDSDLDESE